MKPYSVIRILIFLLMILTPASVMFMGIDPRVDLEENRSLVPFPKVKKWKRYFQPKEKIALEGYLNDHFGLRRLFALLELNWNTRVIRTPLVRTVVFGEDGWLFFVDKKDNSYYPGVPEFTGAQLEQMTRSVLEQHAYCKERGIQYLLVIAPDKQSIYPEFLPSWYRPPAAGETPLDQWLAHLKTREEGFPLVDLRKDLIQAKSSYPEKLLFWKTDTHWTPFGAFFGYRAILETLSSQIPQLQVKDIGDFRLSVQYYKAGDLAQTVGFRPPKPERAPIPLARAGKIEKRIDTPIEYQRYYDLNQEKMEYIQILETTDASLPKAVVLRDSFATNLIPLLSGNFKRIIYRWHKLKDYNFDTNLMENEKPDVVILELVERSLFDILHDANPPELKRSGAMSVKRSTEPDPLL